MTHTNRKIIFGSLSLCFIALNIWTLKKWLSILNNVPVAPYQEGAQTFLVIAGVGVILDFLFLAIHFLLYAIIKDSELAASLSRAIAKLVLVLLILMSLLVLGLSILGIVAGGGGADLLIVGLITVVCFVCPVVLLSLHISKRLGFHERRALQVIRPDAPIAIFSWCFIESLKTVVMLLRV